MIEFASCKILSPFDQQCDQGDHLVRNFGLFRNGPNFKERSEKCISLLRKSKPEMLILLLSAWEVHEIA